MIFKGGGVQTPCPPLLDMPMHVNSYLMGLGIVKCDMSLHLCPSDSGRENFERLYGCVASSELTMIIYGPRREQTRLCACIQQRCRPACISTWSDQCLKLFAPWKGKNFNLLHHCVHTTTVIWVSSLISVLR